MNATPNNKSGFADSSPGTPVSEPARRGFMTSLGAIVAGAIVSLVPAASGLFTFLDPLSRKGKKDNWVRVASLTALPDDDVPRQFAILADKQDAWNKFPNEPVGAVYLRRAKGSKKIQALNATCPHAGCFVSFKSEASQFQCPCHTSKFDVEGGRVLPCVSPRAMDSLEVDEKKLAKSGEIWVRFQRFYTGKTEKLAMD